MKAFAFAAGRRAASGLVAGAAASSTASARELTPTAVGVYRCVLLLSARRKTLAQRGLPAGTDNSAPPAALSGRVKPCAQGGGCRLACDGRGRERGAEPGHGAG